MRFLLATLLLVSASPPIATAAEDRYSGRYSASCGDLTCELDIKPAGRDRWTIRWTATDPMDFDLKPVCSFRTEAEIGSAQMGPAGIVEGIAVGRVRGRPFGLFDLDAGRVSWSSSWAACPGLSPKGIYGQLDDG